MSGAGSKNGSGYDDSRTANKGASGSADAADVFADGSGAGETLAGGAGDVFVGDSGVGVSVEESCGENTQRSGCDGVRDAANDRCAAKELEGDCGGGRLLLLVAGWLCRIGLAAVFLYAGWVKLLAPADFVQDILNYRLVGAPAAFWIAVVLPPLEIALGLCLLVTPLARASALAVAVLCVGFLFAILSAWLRGLDISCGCFGAATAVVSYPLLVLRSCLLIAAALTAFAALGRRCCRRGGR